MQESDNKLFFFFKRTATLTREYLRVGELVVSGVSTPLSVEEVSEILGAAGQLGHFCLTNPM